MTGFVSILPLAARVVLAFLISVELFEHFQFGGSGIPLVHISFSGGYPFEVLLLAGMAVAAIWLAFGIQTRIAALVGVAFLMICERADYITGYNLQFDPIAVFLPIALGALLLALGGGKWSLYRDDYHSLL